MLLQHLALTLAFFSRVPLPRTLGGRISHDDKLGEAAYLFPVAGMIIAVPVALTWYAGSFYLPSFIAAGLAIGIGLLITGGLHEDGFADCADGLGATSKRERALEIMRDSRIGTYGTLALILSVGLRWAALASLSPIAGILAIFVCHSGARSAMTIAMQTSHYARTDGLGKQADDMTTGNFFLTLGIALAIAFCMGWFWGIVALILGWIAAWIFLKRLETRLGGYTGDGLGAMEQIAEIVILVTLAGAWS